LKDVLYLSLGDLMPLLPHKIILAIGAVVDIALHPGKEPVSAADLAGRLHLHWRYLEPVLQALVRKGILEGVRGRKGGYKLAKARGAISLYDISKAAKTIDTEEANNGFPGLLGSVVVPKLADVEAELETRLKRITVEDLVQTASRENRPKPKSRSLGTINFGRAPS
jgi:Rrf2 family iron-sulfur cluster assembly transcriptional regulator